MREIRFYDDNFDLHRGRVERRNGNLTLVTDEATGEPHWLADFEIADKNHRPAPRSVRHPSGFVDISF